MKYSQEALAHLLTVYGYGTARHNIYGDVEQDELFTPIETREGTIEEYMDILTSAVKTRTRANNWVFLSSGWDSTAILAILHHLKANVRCVIGEMRYSTRSGVLNHFEIERAKKFADHYGVQLDIVPFDLTGPDATGYWQSLVPYQRQQHIYGPTVFNFSRLTDYVVEHGGPDDAIICGEYSDGAHNMGFAQGAESDKHYNQMFSPKIFEMINPIDFFISFFVSPVRDLKCLCTTDILTDYGTEEYYYNFSLYYLSDAIRNATPETLYSWMIHLYKSFYWRSGNVKGVSSRANSLNRTIQFPFADETLLRFLSEMPETWGRGWGDRPTKYPLKEMLKRMDYPMHLQTGEHSYDPNFNHTHEILFHSYVSHWFKSILYDYPYEKILSGEYFNLFYLRTLVDDYRAGKELVLQEQKDLMALVMLCVTGWH